METVPQQNYLTMQGPNARKDQPDSHARLINATLDRLGSRPTYSLMGDIPYIM